MRVAVLSLTRDRLEYTKRCFGLLRELGGCRFDHYVLDNGSTDGTQDWLWDEYRPHAVGLVVHPDNIGVNLGINQLLDAAGPTDYDVIVKFDNDCELTQEGTLRVACELVMEHPKWVLSPRIGGLKQPPGHEYETLLGGERVASMSMIGGIFMAAPGSLYHEYRHNPGNPIWGMDDVSLCHHWKKQGGKVGYLLDHVANHIETTDGQRARFPDYFARKDREFAA